MFNKIKDSALPAIIIFIILVVCIISAIRIITKKPDNGNVNPNITEEPKEEPIQKVELESKNFDINFLKLENKKENIIYSPLSIKYALKMLNDGAEENTKTQIENVIGTEELPKYENIEKVLSLANCVYIRNKYSNSIKNTYKKELNKNYNAEIKYDEFKNANNINKYIEEKTLGKLKDILKDEQVNNPDNIMILINALAIDMAWSNKFDAQNTKQSEFYLENGDTMKATTMHEKTSSKNVSYYKKNDVTALAMNLKKYDDTQFEFVAIMPEENLDEYVNKLSIEDLNNILGNLTMASNNKAGLKISIPRFKFNYSLKIKEDLKSLGITDAFEGGKANFSKMSEHIKDLHVSEAIHKADIDFTEKGVKAAASTVIIASRNMAIAEQEKPIEININKAFLFLIRDKGNGEIWFVGTVYEPNAWEQDKTEYGYK